jgi:hypothetical protein
LFSYLVDAELSVPAGGIAAYVAARSEIDACENPFPDEFGQAEQIVLHRSPQYSGEEVVEPVAE